MQTLQHRTVHRFMPAAEKHGTKTACGIPLLCGFLCDGEAIGAMADDGGVLAVSMKGKQFDCTRCRHVLETHHKGRMS